MIPHLLEKMVYEKLLNAIDPDFIEVQIMPEDDLDFELPMDRGKVVVAFESFDFNKELLSNLPIIQEQRASIYLTLMSRTLRGETGIYTMYNLCKAALIGYVPKDCTCGLYGKYFGSPEIGTKPRVGDIWTFEFHLETKGVEVEADGVNFEDPDDPTNTPEGQILPLINLEYIYPAPPPIGGPADTITT